MTANSNLPAFAQNGLPEWRRRLLRDWLLYPIGFNFLVKPQFFGTEHIPAAGPTILLMNHIASIDPVVVGNAVKKRTVTPLAKQEVMSYPVLSGLIKFWGAIPVDREGVDRRALLQALAVLQEGHILLIAGEGTRSPQLQPLKEGFVYLATKANAAIVPAAVNGTDQFGSNLRRLRRTPVTVHYGRPFRFRSETRRIQRENMRLMADEAGYQIARMLPAERRGVYSDLDQATTETLEFV